MARGRRGSGARGNRGRKSRTSSRSSSSRSSRSTSSRSRNTRGSGARGNRGRTTSTRTTRTSKTTNTKSTQSSQSTNSRSRRGANYAGLAKKLGVHASVVKNQAAMRDRARARHAKFKQTRVQTFGGKKTNFSKAEQKRITDAGYRVQGYSKAPAQSSTQLQINKDNAMYGNTVPTGSFNISEEGKRIAEQNKAEAAAKKKAAEAAAKKEATRKSTFDPGRLKGGILTQASAAFADTFAKPKYMYQGNFAGRLPGLSNYFSPDAGAAATYSRSGALKGIPFAGGSASGTLTRFNVPDGAKIGRSPLGIRQFKLNPKQMTQLGKGITVAGDDVAKVAAKGLGKYGARAVPFVGAGLSLADSFNRVREGDYTGAALAAGSAIPGPVGWASLAGLAAKDISSAINTKETKTASVDAGGLNIGSTGGVDSGEAEGSGTGRTLTARFNKPGLDTLAGGLDFATNDRFDFDNLGKGFFGYGAVTPSNVINDAMSIAQNKNLTVKDMGTFLNTVKDVSTSDDKLGTVKNIIADQDTTSRLLGPVYNQLRNSEIVDSLATKKLGLPDNYGEQLDQTKGAIETAYNKLGTDNKANRKIISDLFIGNDPNLNLLKRGAEQFTNESGTIANYQDKTNLAKFQDSFKENSPLFKGLNKDERGMIGSLGNWRLSNLGTKIVGDNLEGTKNVADLASNIIDTAGTNKATQSFLKTIGVKGAPTPKSIIGGALPKFGVSSGTGNPINRLKSSAGFNATTLAAATPTSVEEVLPLPTTATQTGTDSGNLASIIQTAYQNQMSLYGMNPNYMANFRRPRFNTRPKRFRQVFNRGYF